MFTRWTFYDICNAQETNLFGGWFDTLTPMERARVHAMLDLLKHKEVLGPPQARKWKGGGECEGLRYLRVSAPDRMEIRVFYECLPNWKMVLLCGAQKKSNRLVPEGACQTAKELKKLLSTPGHSKIIEHER